MVITEVVTIMTLSLHSTIYWQWNVPCIAKFASCLPLLGLVMQQLSPEEWQIESGSIHR
jgi:hypothetical protein